jgi:hypothetical protein
MCETGRHLSLLANEADAMTETAQRNEQVLDVALETIAELRDA